MTFFIQFLVKRGFIQYSMAVWKSFLIVDKNKRHSSFSLKENLKYILHYSCCVMLKCLNLWLCNMHCGMFTWKHICLSSRNASYCTWRFVLCLLASCWTCSLCVSDHLTYITCFSLGNKMMHLTTVQAGRMHELLGPVWLKFETYRGATSCRYGQDIHRVPLVSFDGLTSLHMWRLVMWLFCWEQD